MDRYEILGMIGEGSFGRVFKARNKETEEIVAFKIIRKCGRSQKELRSLRQECEIQQYLHHPNIIHMIESFETDSEIVVVTEFADKELYEILGKEGYLPESQVQKIACDLVSALYYLHSNRVLHRDLKPQNILLEANGVAKLCDFGFARSMSTGTHVLTSIKGTPLYMAPELVEGNPYDHNADLWSLGCIVYELLVGSPPFCTTSILHLVRLIRHEAIKWPDFISEDCKSFIQGLLQKDPGQRLTWPHLLTHPFVKDRIVIQEKSEINANPLTNPLTASQIIAKEIQKQNLANHSARAFSQAIGNLGEQDKMLKLLQKHEIPLSKPSSSMEVQSSNIVKDIPLIRNDNVNTVKAQCHQYPSEFQERNARSAPCKKVEKWMVVSQTDKVRVSCKSADFYQSCCKCKENCNLVERNGASIPVMEGAKILTMESKLNKDFKQEFPDVEVESRQLLSQMKVISLQGKTVTLQNWNSSDLNEPIENEEWLVFLQHTMEEVMEGEIDAMRQKNFLSIVLSPLKNPGANCRVVEFVACLLSLPFVVDEIGNEEIEYIKQAYLDVKAIPNLMYASVLLAQCKTESSDENQTKSWRSMSDMSADELHAIECIYLLICHLVHISQNFIVQFCDAVVVLNAAQLLKKLLFLGRRKVRIVTDLLAILCHILKCLPENATLVEKVVFEISSAGDGVDLNSLLLHNSHVVRSRTCILIRLLGQYSCRALKPVWNKQVRENLENLVLDSNINVKTAAEQAVNELKTLTFYSYCDPT